MARAAADCNEKLTVPKRNDPVIILLRLTSFTNIGYSIFNAYDYKT